MKKTFTKKKKRGKKKFYLITMGVSLLLLALLLFWAWLFSSPLKGSLVLEAGDFTLTDTDFLKIRIPGLNYRVLTDLTSIDSHEPGDYAVQFLINGETQVCLLSIRDTVPPKAHAQDVALAVGSPCPPEAFFTSLTDETKVAARLWGLPDDPEALSPGDYPLSLLLTDAGGNQTSYPVSLKIKNVRASCQAELGVEDFPVSHYRLSDSEELSYKEDISPLLSQVGTHTVTLLADGDEVSVTLTVADTLPPEIKTRKVSLWLGEKASPDDFVKKLSDASKTTVSYREKPDFSKAGSYKVRLVAKDAYGNKKKFTAKLIIKEDTLGPDILGAKDLTFPQGTTITYRKSVFAVDNKDGTVGYQVDSSQVNPGKQGTYPVTYLAEDSSGNQSSVTVHITITEPLPITEEEVWALADEILLELHIPLADSKKDSGNNDYENLFAIYDWCRSNIHYTGTSDKSSELAAAYDGFTTRSGDCYTYFSVADTLMTRAGYESMEIDRTGTETFHSWNLVKYQDAWYHFDACPLIAGETFVPFLVSDEDLIAFSKDYGKRHTDASHQNYYQFNPDSYPERGKVSITDGNN